MTLSREAEDALLAVALERKMPESEDCISLLVSLALIAWSESCQRYEPTRSGQLVAAYIREHRPVGSPMSSSLRDGSMVGLLMSDGTPTVGEWDEKVGCWSTQYGTFEDEPTERPPEDGEVWPLYWFLIPGKNTPADDGKGNDDRSLPDKPRMPSSEVRSDGEAGAPADDSKRGVRDVQVVPSVARASSNPEPPRPYYVPDGVPWAFVVDGLARTVVAWLRSSSSVCIHDPDHRKPARWSPTPGMEFVLPLVAEGASTRELASQCAALLRGEIGWGHKKDSGATGESKEAKDLSPPATVEAQAARQPASPGSENGSSAAGSALSAGPSGHIDSAQWATENAATLATMTGVERLTAWFDWAKSQGLVDVKFFPGSDPTATLEQRAEAVFRMVICPDSELVDLDELDAEDADDRTSNAGPSGELAKDEIVSFEGDRGRMRMVDDGRQLEIHWLESKSSRWWTHAELKQMAGDVPNSNGFPRALAFFEEHCGKEEKNVGQATHGSDCDDGTSRGDGASAGDGGGREVAAALPADVAPFLDLGYRSAKCARCASPAPPRETETPEQIAAQVHSEFLEAVRDTEEVAARLDAAARRAST